MGIVDFSNIYFFLIFFRSSPSETIKFNKVEIQGGGRLIIESNGKGANLVGSVLQVESGGTLEVDYITINVSHLIVNDAAKIIADAKVRICIIYL